MKQAGFPFHETAEDATNTAIIRSGKHFKEVAHALWPDHKPDSAYARLKNALRPDAREAAAAMTGDPVPYTSFGEYGTDPNEPETTEDPPASVVPSPQPGQAEGEEEVQTPDSGGELDNQQNSSETPPAPPEKAGAQKAVSGGVSEQRGDDASPDRRHPIAQEIEEHLEKHGLAVYGCNLGVSCQSIKNILEGRVQTPSDKTLKKIRLAMKKQDKKAPAPAKKPDAEDGSDPEPVPPRPITAPIRNNGTRIRNPKEAADFLKSVCQDYMKSESLDPTTAAQALSITRNSMMLILQGTLPHQAIIQKLADKLPEVAQAKGLLLHQRHVLDQQEAAAA